jgi:hypothetical protein
MPGRGSYRAGFVADSGALSRTIFLASGGREAVGGAARRGAPVDGLRGGASGCGVFLDAQGAVGPRVLLDGAEGAVGGGAEDRGVRAEVADRG